MAALLPWYTRSLSVKRAAPVLGRWHYEITEDGIRMTNPIANSQVLWQNLKSFDEHPLFWVVRTPIKHQAIVVVKAAFSPTDQQAITALGRNKITGTKTPLPRENTTLRPPAMP
jgi:hypothetical protein